MKKKLLTIVTIIVLCLSLYACGGGNQTIATITDAEGNTSEMTLQELRDIYDENAAKYEDTYGKRPKITMTGTVQSVDSVYSYLGCSIYQINLENGYTVEVASDLHEEVSNLSKGDKIEISSKIDIFGETISDLSVTVSTGKPHDKTTITIL